MSKIVVTGCAGFIGMHVCKLLLRHGHEVVGFDNLNDYYDPALKEARLRQLVNDRFTFKAVDLADKAQAELYFNHYEPDDVIHLAAQAGVRYSIENPHSYAENNLTGFLNVLEACRRHDVDHLVYASSSSVYGYSDCGKPQIETVDAAVHPESLYAATKRANELMAHSYSSLYGLPTTGLRYFTVYGEWGRPDMALSIFAEAILNEQPMRLFNNGDMRRDYTHVDDAAAATVKALYTPPQAATVTFPNTSSSGPYVVYNVGRGSPVSMRYVVELLEKALGKKAIIEEAPMQPGDVLKTWASEHYLKAMLNFEPQVSIEEGIERFARWYADY